MPAYILTGAPGSGKTAVLRMLEDAGYLVVEEAATDVIALGQALGCSEPWEEAGFIDKVVALQRRRVLSRLPGQNGGIVFFDRSPVCTLALSRYLGLAPSASPSLAFERIHEETYRELDFRLVDVPAGPLVDRVALISRFAGRAGQSIA
jgi:predicted ATPase